MQMNASKPDPTRRRLAAAVSLTGLCLALALATTAFSCSTNPQGPGMDPRIDDPEAFWVNATVQFTPIEGGCWTLVVDDKTYEPINLEEDYREDGLAVRVALKPRPDMMSVCMIGELVEVLSIRRR